MQLNENDIKKFSVIAIIIFLGVLVFFLLKPVLLSIIAGLILAYIFTPLFKRVQRPVTNKSVAAFFVSLLIILLIVIPLWFIVPLMLKQVFDIFTFSQKISFQGIVTNLLPTASDQLVSQMSITLDNFVGTISKGALEVLTSFFLDLPRITLHLFIVFFVFFYSLRDGDRLASFVSAVSPFSKTKEKLFVSQFKNITDSVMYGQIIVGLVQGSLAGLGFLIFGIHNALVLTVVAIFLSILPIIGPFVLWIPIVVYLFSTGQTGIAIGYLLYNVIVVSAMDNILRTYLVSRKTDISPAIILVAMIGGFFIFGVLGLLLGPLIAAYFILFLQAYKDKTLSHLFPAGEHNQQ